MIGDATTLHDTALDAAMAVVAGVPDTLWDGPTPCTRWTVRNVVEHLAWGHRTLAVALTGAAFHEPGGGRTIALPEPVPAAHRAVVEEVRRSVRAAGNAQTVAFPTGPLPLVTALLIRVQDIVVHCWDVAVATGQRPVLDDDAVRAAERVARDRLAAGTLGAPQFAPARPFTGTTSRFDRLLLTVGRDPQWSRPALSRPALQDRDIEGMFGR